jgi:hypothetical protein
MCRSVICRNAVALVAAYAIALGALLSASAVVKRQAAEAGTWHRIVCTSDRSTADGGNGTPEPHSANCLAICAALASGCGDSAGDRGAAVASARPDARFSSVSVADDGIGKPVTIGAYRSRAPPRA